MYNHRTPAFSVYDILVATASLNLRPFLAAQGQALEGDSLCAR